MAQAVADQNDTKESKQNEVDVVEFYFGDKKLSKQEHVLLFEYMGDISQEAAKMFKDFIYKQSNEKQGLLAQPFNKWLIDDKLHAKEPDEKKLSNYDFGARARIPIIFGDSKYVTNRFPIDKEKNKDSLFNLQDYQTIIYLMIEDKPSKTELKDKTIIVHGNEKNDLKQTVQIWLTKMTEKIESGSKKINVEEFVI